MRDYPLTTPDEVANMVLMLRSHPGRDHHAFLLVEGATDKRVYKRFVDEKSCDIVVADGKERAIGALSILEQDNFVGVLAIVDADFLPLEETLPASPNLLLTDYHDLELMMLSSSALEKVLDELGSARKIQDFVEACGKDLRTWLLLTMLPMGYLRLLSLQERLEFKFEGLHIEKFIDEQKLIIIKEKLIRNVQNLTPENTRLKNNLSDLAIQEKLTHIMDDSHNPLHICCGHDVISLLALGLNRKLGSGRVKHEEVERALRLAYEFDHFKQTRLYLAIQQWEQGHVPFLVLKTSS